MQSTNLKICVGLFLSQIWFPRLLIKNNFDEVQAMMDEFAFVFVKPEAKPLVSSLLSELDENQIYEGKSNPLIYLRYFDLNVRCNFEFTYFPFDTQKCTVWVRLHFFTTHKH